MQLLAFIALLIATASAAQKGPFLDEGLDTGIEPQSEVEPVTEGDPGRCPTAWLQEGVQLPESPLYKRWHADTAWGTPEMVDLLLEAGEAMHALAPHADPFVVGDISTESGGPLYGHKSHRAGIDADIGLYFGKAKQHLDGFRVVAPVELDTKTTWLLIHTLLDTGMMERILLDRGLIDALRTFVVESGELTPEEAEDIFPRTGTPAIWNHNGVVHHAPNHKHHLHVRIRCSDQARTDPALGD